MASAEQRGGQYQPEEGNIGRRQFLRKMLPGTIVGATGLGAAVVENMQKKPNYLRQSGELLVALAGIGWNIRTLWNMKPQENGNSSQEPQTTPQK